MVDKYRRSVCPQMGCHRRSVRYLFWHTFLGNAKAKEGEHFQFKASHWHHQRSYRSSNSNIHLRPSNRLYNNLYNVYNLSKKFIVRNRLIKNLCTPFHKKQHNGCLAHLRANKSLSSQMLNLECNMANSNRNSSRNCADLRY